MRALVVLALFVASAHQPYTSGHEVKWPGIVAGLIARLFSRKRK